MPPCGLSYAPTRNVTLSLAGILPAFQPGGRLALRSARRVGGKPSRVRVWAERQGEIEGAEPLASSCWGRAKRGHQGVCCLLDHRSVAQASAADAREDASAHRPEQCPPDRREHAPRPIGRQPYGDYGNSPADCVAVRSQTPVTPSEPPCAAGVGTVPVLAGLSPRTVKSRRTPSTIIAPDAAASVVRFRNSE